MDKAIMGPAGLLLPEDLPEDAAGPSRAELGAPMLEAPLVGESGRIEDISQDIGYLQGLTGVGMGDKLSFEEKQRLKAKYKTYAPQIIPADARKAKTATREMMTVAGEVFKALDDPVIGELAGKADQYLEGLGRLFGKGWTKDELEQDKAYEEWRETAESAKLSTRSTTLVWKILRAIQGSRPSDFDMQVYEKTLKVVSQIRNPILAAETLASFIGDNYTSVIKDIREFGEEPVEGDPGFKNYRTFGRGLDEIESDWGGLQTYIPGTPEWHKRTGLTPKQLDEARLVETYPMESFVPYDEDTPAVRTEQPKKSATIEKAGAKPVVTQEQPDPRKTRAGATQQAPVPEAGAGTADQNARVAKGLPIVASGDILEYSYPEGGSFNTAKYFMVDKEFTLPNKSERFDRWGEEGNFPKTITVPRGAVIALSGPDYQKYKAYLGSPTGATEEEYNKYNPPSEKRQAETGLAEVADDIDAIEAEFR
jgi:hypothetical protein